MSASHFADSQSRPLTDSRFEQSLKVIYADFDSGGVEEPDDSFEQWFSEWNEQSDRIEEQLRFIEAQLGHVQEEPPVQLFVGDASNT